MKSDNDKRTITITKIIVLTNGTYGIVTEVL